MRIRTLKVIAVVMILMMLINVIPISAFVEDNIGVSDKMVLSVSSVNGIPGGTTQVSIILKNNPGIASLKFNIEYDDDLTLTDVAFNSSFGPYVTTPKPYVNPQTITLISPLTDISAEGILATLTFNISEEVPDGYVAEINIAYDVDDVYNGNYDSVALDVVNGRVTVYDGIPGDIDGDSKVGTQDAIILFRYIAGWSVDVDPDALDVNGDNKINSKDAITLFRYVAGWENIELHRGKTCAHELTHIPEIAATCKENGQIAHWQCSLCSKYFGDENAAVEVSVEDMVIPATGHTEVIDEAVAPTHDSTGLTEGKHCSVCNTVLLEQQVVPKLEASYHSITYKNIKAAESPDQTSYAEHEGLLDLPEISVPGYNFLGWYTASENGSKIDYILAGDTKDYVLFAHWELVYYTITYQDAPVNNNPSTYTIEDEIVLKNAEWSGLMF